MNNWLRLLLLFNLAMITQDSIFVHNFKFSVLVKMEIVSLTNFEQNQILNFELINKILSFVFLLTVIKDLIFKGQLSYNLSHWHHHGGQLTRPAGGILSKLVT